MKKSLLLLSCLALSLIASAQNDTGKNAAIDTVKKDFTAPDTVKHLHSKLSSWLIPAGLVTYGGLSFVVKPIRNVDYYFKGVAERTDAGYNSKAADYLQAAPAVAVYALNLLGDEGQNRFWDRTALLGLSGLILTAADGTKYLAHRVRPYGTDPLSFPSGHTGAAFLAAEFMAQEYGAKSPWYGVVAYSCATVTGVMRIYSRAHWFSDIVAGAGFGILSVKTAYWLYPHIRNALTHKGPKGRTTTLVPTYQYGAPGMAFMAQF